jgi:hypothetical protein
MSSESTLLSTKVRDWAWEEKKIDAAFGFGNRDERMHWG